MWLLFVALLGPQTPQLPDTSGAYLDAGARELVARAREHRGTFDGGIRGYRALVKNRMAVGLQAMRRDRLLMGEDIVARIDWRRDDTTRVEMLGARMTTPMFTRGFSVPHEARRPGALVFEPTDDRLRLGLMDTTFVRHPLGAGSEADYRFQSGDSTLIQLPDGRRLRLLELRVIPRRTNPHLLRGSLWIDAASYAVVRGLFRLAGDFDLERDADPEDRNDVKDVPGVLKPIRAELRFLTIEYGLVGLRWWMPRLIALEGSVQVGRLASMPFRYERVYSEYSVDGDTVRTVLAAAPVDPRHQKPENCRRSEKGALSCDCSKSDCRNFQVKLPADTAALLTSAELPPPPADAYSEDLVTEQQLVDIGRRLGILPREPWRVGTPSLHWGLARAGLLRYNRVEGLSLAARGDWDLGRLQVDATGRLGMAVAAADSPRALRLTPSAELGATREALHGTYRAAGYWRVDGMDPATRALGFGNSFNALFFGRDDGDYFRALGLELSRHAARGTEEHVTWRLFAERQTPLTLETQLSLRRLFGSGPTFRPNLTAQDAREAGAELALRWSGGAATAPRWTGALSADGAAGTFRYARPSALLQVSLPLPLRLIASTEGAAGTSVGTVPLQRSWFLGGPATLRGYPGAAVYGDAFWRGRAELATSFPAARLAVFGDAGWAGSRRDFSAGRPLYSAGVGASFLDGYIRVDAARALRGTTGWRVDLYLDALL